MDARTWWPLFPLLFLTVLTTLTISVRRLARYGKAGRVGWAGVISALFFYIMTFVMGRWHAWHMPMSNLAEVCMLFNIVYFFQSGRKDIAWLNVIALVAVGADFALHVLMR